MKKILCIGEALIDMICTDKGKSLSEGQHFLKKPGGAPTNVAAAIAALGGRVELAAKVGADPFGEHLIDVMESFGVETRWVLKDEKYFTTFAFVSLMDSGERDFYFNRGADGQLNRQEVEDIDLLDCAVVHFGSATGFLPGPLQAAYQGLLQKTLQHDILISFDPNYRHLLFKDDQQSFIDQSWNFLKCCHFFKVSDEEALMISGAVTVNDAAALFLEKTNAVFAITLGKDGTLLGCRGEITVIPSIPVKPVDTTGAGDAFVGAVLYQLQSWSERPGLANFTELSPADWQTIITNANKAGARTCEWLGAMEAFKHLSNDIFK
ncbi:MAG TPA: carbohydrate kinase [Chitinophagaceae bacterium]|nr:carbohydrate kinase [Chitinophagaceae bacterium]